VERSASGTDLMNPVAVIKKNGLVITLHVAGLLLYIFSPLFFGAIRSSRFEGIHLTLILHNALIATFFYLNMLVLMPLVLKKKGWVAYLVIGLICTVVFTILSHQLRDAFFTREFRPPLFDQGRMPRPRVFQYIGVSLPYIMAWVFSTSVKFSMDYFRSERNRKDRENENLKSELSLLRSQISPHFMFNVLNSLTALARRKSDELEPIIIKLSQLMRYTIYYSAVPSDNAVAGRVELETELEYLQNYIDLQTLRFGQHIKVNFARDVVQHDYMIEPVLLISFVENAFKHGATMVSDPIIHIQVSCSNDVLKFTVKNRFVPNTNMDETHGVGLRNVRRRLELLYEDKYQLEIKENEPWFIVNLTLIGT
jgi:two-component system, LytTR family, sensor kinase